MCLLDVMHACELKENIPSSSLNVVVKDLILTIRHRTKTREPRLMANWNSGKRYTDCRQAEWFKCKVTTVAR